MRGISARAGVRSGSYSQKCELAPTGHSIMVPSARHARASSLDAACGGVTARGAKAARRCDGRWVAGKERQEWIGMVEVRAIRVPAL